MIEIKNLTKEFDGQLAEFLEEITEDDLVIITADHGNDPTFTGTDHTREYIPVLMYHKGMQQGVKL